MRSRLFAVAAGLLFCVPAGATAEEGKPAKEEAQALVRSAVSFIRQAGAEAAYREITGRTGKFNEGELYVVVYRLDGRVLAHGANKQLVGVDMSEVQDSDGKYFVKERIELARKEATFWHTYKFINPVSKKVEMKETYCERLDETAVCSGVYSK